MQYFAKKDTISAVIPVSFILCILFVIAILNFLYLVFIVLDCFQSYCDD